ncbi:hypothetical protein TRIUR3_33817 [Triticum urartu]|uniref:Uncharacterized protein n=1 Tax=Triticum urartu TaxID=4572 RepID=M7ZW98_TRIUA|nr:hypothetical protein TRIUR3_33817 [Triticum urartu]
MLRYKRHRTIRLELCCRGQDFQWQQTRTLLDDDPARQVTVEVSHGEVGGLTRQGRKAARKSERGDDSVFRIQPPSQSSSGSTVEATVWCSGDGDPEKTGGSGRQRQVVAEAESSSGDSCDLHLATDPGRPGAAMVAI